MCQEWNSKNIRSNEFKVEKGLTQNQKKNHNGFETIREDSLYQKIGANEIEILTHTGCMNRGRNEHEKDIY
jgi:hypothetical protein